MLAWQLTPYIIPLIAAGIIAALVCVFSWRNPEPDGAVALGWLSLFAFIWSAGYAMEIGSAGLAAKIFWAKVQYIGIVAVPVAWLAFTLHYTNRKKWINPQNITLALTIPVMTLILVWTNESHHLIWQTTTTFVNTPLPVLVVTYGTLFWVYWIFAQVALLAGTAILINRVRHTQPLYRTQTIVVTTAALAPWVGNGLYIARILPGPLANLDLTSFAFTISGAIIAWDIFRFRFMDVIPVARKAVIDGMVDGMIVLDKQDRIVDINPAVQSIAGIFPRSIGLSLHDVLTNWEELSSFCREQSQGQIELKHMRPDGSECWFDVRLNPLHDKGQLAGRLIVLRDITARKQVEQALALARDEALSASQFKSQLLAKVSHELRTPLGVILGYIELLQRGSFGPVPENQVEVVKRVVQSTHYLTQLINELLDQAQLDAGKLTLQPASFELRSMIDQACAPLSILAEEKKLSLIVEIDETLPQWVVCDQYRLQQILNNLTSNAIKFTTKGQVHVRAYLYDAEHWALEVTDSGTGMSPESQQFVFEPFWQTGSTPTSNVRGYGLGLSIVKQLTTLMGGEIKLDSEMGRGSSFTIVLPLKVAEAKEGVK
jgi:PAS domain S-box-containing protein